MANKERLYYIWKSMRERCRHEPLYVDRGIKVCDEWNNYSAFRDWAYANGYDKNANGYSCSIDRINNDGNYEPSNCRWVDMKTQGRNKRNNRMITFRGKTKAASEWAEQINITPDALYNRLNKGWSIEEAITYPKLKSNRKYDKRSPISKVIEIGGVKKTMLDWCEVYKIDKDLVGKRLKYGWDIVDAITREPREYRRRVQNG